MEIYGDIFLKHNPTQYVNSMNDYVGIQNKNNLVSDKSQQPSIVTDYARILSKISATYFILRDDTDSIIDYSPGSNTFSTTSIDFKSACVRPTICINIDSIRAKDSPLGKYQIFNLSNKHYGLIQFDNLVFPQTILYPNHAQEISALYDKGDLKKTGRKYVGGFDTLTNKVLYNDEYEYNGKLYVPVVANNSAFSDVKVRSDKDGLEYYWFKVEPICWVAQDYDNLPKWINPNGLGIATRLYLRSDFGLISGLPFNIDNKNEFNKYYQNSLIRAYLDGFKTTEKMDKFEWGDKSIWDGHVHDFKNNGFIDEIFLEGKSLSTNQSLEQSVPVDTTVKNNKKGNYGVKVDNTPISIKEQMQFYLNTGKSFMLHGPSGIGKTRRVEELDPDCVMLQLRNGILPEEIIGKTAFENQTSIWVEPTWYTRLKEICEKDPKHNHILFIDELTNVHANEQSLVYHIVLEHSIDGNIGELPKNCIVVAAGNNPEESEAAYTMPEPLFRRFDAHIELKPDIKSWIEWGSELNDKGKPKIHPLIADFVATYGEKVFYTKYDPENPPKFAVDPRAWEQVSNIIYDNNNVLRSKLIEDKVGTDIASSLIDFASQYHLSLSDIVKGNYEESDIPTSENQKFALTCSLRVANEKQLPIVRQFIEKYLGREKLATFDRLWAEQDDEHALFLNDLLEQENKSQNANDDDSQLN